MIESYQNVTNLPSSKTHELLIKSKEIESLFLSEMLSYAGLLDEESSFFGSSGSAQMSSFLRDEYAQEIVKSGGIGLAKNIFESLLKLQK